MDSTTKDELKISIPQSMLRTPKITGEKMNDDKFKDEIIEFLIFIQEACTCAIRALDDDEEYCSASFELGQIYGAASAISNKIEEANND